MGVAATTERFHPRVEANFMVQVHVNGRSVVAKARDLSMAGLFLLAHPGDAEQRLTLTLPLPGGEDIVTRCHIRRREAQGVALEFDMLDWDEMIALARYLSPRLP
jgi:PilZ domain